MKEKKLLCVAGPQNSGKTTILKLVYKKLTGIEKNEEFNEVVSIADKKIAIISQGDPGTNLTGKIDYYINQEEIDIIVFAARKNIRQTNNDVYRNCMDYCDSLVDSYKCDKIITVDITDEANTPLKDAFNVKQDIADKIVRTIINMLLSDKN